MNLTGVGTGWLLTCKQLLASALRLLATFLAIPSTS